MHVTTYIQVFISYQTNELLTDLLATEVCRSYGSQYLYVDNTPYKEYTLYMAINCIILFM